MGIRILKQPDGKYAMWSSYTDSIVGFDCTKEELVEVRCREAARQCRDELSMLDRKSGCDIRAELSSKICVMRSHSEEFAAMDEYEQFLCSLEEACDCIIDRSVDETGDVKCKFNKPRSMDPGALRTCVD